MRLKLNILLITLLALFSCAKESGERGSDDQGTGTLHVRFDIPANAGVTKGDGVSGGGYDGTHNVLEKDNIIQHGRLFLVDNDGTVVAYRKASDIKMMSFIENSSRTEVITGIKRGNYKLYVFVNGSKEQANKFDDNHETLVGSKLNSTTLLETKLSKNDLVGGNSPTFAETEGIPCTFVTDVAITAGNNYVDAHLERCVGRLTIKVLNNIPDRKLAIRSIGLSADNPTNGYYFPSSSAVTKGAFPELEGVVEFALNENKTIFDHYVYETDVLSEGLTFDLFGAVYGDKSTIGTDFRYSYDIYDNIVNNTDHPKDKGLYFLRSAASPNYYIGDLDGTLGCRKFSDEELKNSKDIKKFLWKVTSNSTLIYDYYTLQNLGTNNYMTLNENKAGVDLTNSTSFRLSRHEDGYRLFYYPSSYSWNYYSLTFDSSSATCVGTLNKDDDAKYKWILRQATGDGSIPGAEKEITRNRRQIKIVDTYGDAQPLRQIKRNEHVTVSINIFYNRELGEFDFKVSSWKEISNETTFD
mgnify:CR=1 FL=1